MKNDRFNICKSTQQFAIWAKSMNILKLYSKEKAKYFFA